MMGSTVKAAQAPEWELKTLRQELLLRILLQNLLLMISVVAFAALSIAAMANPHHAWLSASAQGGVNFALALQWCHHGIRTRQLKQYLLLLANPNAGGWENWLPANRPHSFLGARWMISTKGVFLGLGLAMMVIAALLDHALARSLPVIALFLWAATFWFLLTNPKE